MPTGIPFFVGTIRHPATLASRLPRGYGTGMQAVLGLTDRRFPVLRARRARLRALLRLRVFRFGLVGVAGFGVDSATFYALLGALGHYGAATASFFVAATAGWLMNRSFTFRGVMHGSLLRQWGLYLFANSAGAVLNRSAFALLTAFVPLCFHYPILPLAAGALSGMVANFTLSKRVVFR